MKEGKQRAHRNEGASFDAGRLRSIVGNIYDEQIAVK
jgi:hypothetical protein